MSPSVPVEIDRVRRIDGLPIVLAAFVAVVALVAVGFALVITVRRRRRDLAILKTLGFDRRQVRDRRLARDHGRGRRADPRYPLGARGRSVPGARVADELGVGTVPTWPLAAILVSIPAVLLAVNLIATVPPGPPRRTTSGRRPTIGVTVATSLDGIQSPELASIRDDVRDVRRGHPATGATVLAATAVVFVTIAALVGDQVPLGPGRVLGVVLVAAWAAASVFVAVHRPREPLAAVMALAAFVGAALLLGAALAGRDAATDTVRDLGAGTRAVAVALLPGVGLHLALGTPRRWPAHAGTPALGCRRLRRGPRGGACTSSASTRTWRSWPILVVAGGAVVIGLVGYVSRCGAARSVQERARLQWPAWAVVVAGAISATAWVLHELVAGPSRRARRPARPRCCVPLSLALGASERFAVRIDRLLVHTITMAVSRHGGGLRTSSSCSVSAGRPTGDEQTLLGLSMLAAAVAALSWIPVRERLTEFATRRVYGERHAPDEVLRTFGTRLTRAIPLDELLLQLAESLKKTMALERRRGVDAGRRAGSSARCRCPSGVRRTSRSAPRRAGRRARRRVGRGVGEVWLPARLTVDDEVLRVAPITNAGELLGMIVVRRPDGALPFAEDDDQALTELARQVGLALHNVKLDSALQESLDEVRRQADELRASRARIVRPATRSARRIERDLHDGAQQHLVALAVSVNLARQIADTDPDSRATDARADRRGPAGSGAGAARPRARDLPAVAHGPRPGRGAVGRGRPGRAPDGRRGRRHRPLRPGGRGRRLLLLPRGDAERGQARGRRRPATSRSRGRAARCSFGVRDDGAGFDRAGARHRRPRVRQHGRPRRRHRRDARWSSRRRGGAPRSAAGSRSPATGRRRADAVRRRCRTLPQLAEDGGAELLLVHVDGGAARGGVGRQVGVLVGREQHHHGAGMRRQ